VDQQDEQQRDDAVQQMLSLAAGSDDEMDEKHGAASSSSAAVTSPPASSMQDDMAVPSDSDSDFLPADEDSDDSTDDISDTDDDEPAVADVASSSVAAKPAKFKLDVSLDSKDQEPELQRHARTIDALKKDVDALLKDADLLCHGFHTCYLEAFHRKRRKFAPKEVFYVNSWPMRTHYAHLHHHHGPIALLELQRRLGLPIDADQAALFTKLQQEHDRRSTHDMNEATKKQRHRRQAQKRAEAIQADAKTADVPGYKETEEQEQKRIARATKASAKRKAERTSKDEMEDIDVDDEKRAKKRQKSEKKEAATSPSTSEPAVEPFLASSFGSTLSKQGRRRTLSTQALEMLADYTSDEDDDF
jgi:hypothetical protein